MIINKPIKVCDITKKPVKESEVLVPFSVGTRHFDEVSQDAIDKVYAYIDRLGEEKKPRAPRSPKEPIAEPAAKKFYGEDFTKE